MTPKLALQKTAEDFEALKAAHSKDATMLGMVAMCLRAIRDSEDPDAVVAVAEALGYTVK